jgi:phosphocarrier protein
MHKKQHEAKTHRSKGVLVILNDKGLHTRPSTELVKCAAGFNSQVHLSYRDHLVNAKSLLGILMLAAEKGARIHIEAIGDDATQAVIALQELAQKKFNIHY